MTGKSELIRSLSKSWMRVLREHIGIAPHLLDCLLPVGLEDSHRPAGADAVAVEEQHDLPDLLCFQPCMGDSLPALGANAIDGLQFGRALLDHHKNLGSKSHHQLLCENRAGALHQAAGEIPLDPLGGGRRHGLHSAGFELQSVFPIPDPTSLRNKPFPCGDRGHGPDHRRFFPMPLCFYAKDAEAAVLVVKGDALDDAGDFLGVSLALLDRGVHSWGFILTRKAGAWITLTSRISGVSPAWVESWRSMAKRQPKSQPTWKDVKAKLEDFDRAALLGLIQSLYATHKENQTFLHARFGLAEDVLEPYKKTIDRWLWPDVFRRLDTSVSQAKRAISDYKKAVGDPEGLAELMVFYCERSAGFSSDIASDDERYFNALVRMFEQALKIVNALSVERRDDLLTRLDRVRVTSHKIGYGVGDDMDFLMSKFAPKSL